MIDRRNFLQLIGIGVSTPSTLVGAILTNNNCKFPYHCVPDIVIEINTINSEMVIREFTRCKVEIEKFILSLGGISREVSKANMKAKELIRWNYNNATN